jgi:hypothetical protein
MNHYLKPLMEELKKLDSSPEIWVTSSGFMKVIFNHKQINKIKKF